MRGEHKTENKDGNQVLSQESLEFRSWYYRFLESLNLQESKTSTEEQGEIQSAGEQKLEGGIALVAPTGSRKRFQSYNSLGPTKGNRRDTISNKSPSWSK